MPDTLDRSGPDLARLIDAVERDLDELRQAVRHGATRLALDTATSVLYLVTRLATAFPEED